MKLIPLFFILLLGYASCYAPDCKMYENEIYTEDIFQEHIDSAFIHGMKKYLDSYQEPVIKGQNYESYRLTVSSTFKADTSQIIRIEKKGEDVFLNHKKLISLLDSGKTVVYANTIKHTLADWDDFLKVVEQSRFWMLPKEIDREGLDGAVYFIEGRRPMAEDCGKRGYHIVRRWSPEEGGFKELSVQFFKMVEPEK